MKYARPQKYRPMEHTIPNLFSRRVKNTARNRMSTVIGTAAIVRANSTSRFVVTMTRNCTVKPRKKKKSNFSREM